MALIDSAAVAAMAPSRWRWRRATCRMRCIKRTFRNQNGGKTASAMRASCQFSENMTTSMPTRINSRPSSGSRAVTATSCSMPTSPITRTTKSPVLALV